MNKTWIAALAAMALTMVGCQQLTRYPENIRGYWVSKNTTTGYSASLEVLTTDSAIVQIASPTMWVVKDLRGMLSYNPSNGKGTFTATSADAPMVDVQAIDNTSIKVTVTAMDEKKTVLYEGVFMRENKPMNPDPKPTPQTDTTYISVHTFGFIDYYVPNGDYNLVLVGTDTADTEYYATFCVSPKEASFVGHFALLQGNMRKEYSNFIPNYTPSSGSKDFLSPDTMCITVGMSGEKYNLEGRITYMGHTYVMKATDIIGQDQRWGYEPPEATTFNEVYTEFIGFDDRDQTKFGEVNIILDNNKTFMLITFFASDTLTAGTYPVNKTYKEGTVAASDGYIAIYQQDQTSYMGVYEEGTENWQDTYYFDSGQVVVSYPNDSVISIMGDVKTHYGSTIHFTYDGKYGFGGYPEDSTNTAANARLQKR